MNNNNILFAILSSFFLVLLVCATFYVKYKVVSIKKEINDIEDSIIEMKSNSHILRAEISYLNSSARLENLNRKHLHLQVPKTKNILTSRENIIELIKNSCDIAEAK